MESVNQSIKIMLLHILILSACTLPIIRANVEFFEDENYKGTLYTAEKITTTCINFPQILRYKASSIKTDTNIVLYSEADCEGNRRFISKGDHPWLPFFNDKTVSVRAFNSTISDDTDRIKIYEDDNYQTLMYDVKIPDAKTCVTLPRDIFARASSLKSDACVYLFYQPYCDESRLRFDRGATDSLRPYDFNDKLQSFIRCDAEVVTTPRPTKSKQTTTIDVGLTSTTSPPTDNVPGCQCPREGGLSLMTGFLMLVILLLVICIFYAFRERIYVVVRSSFRRSEIIPESDTEDDTSDEVRRNKWLKEVGDLRIPKGEDLF